MSGVTPLRLIVTGGTLLVAAWLLLLLMVIGLIRPSLLLSFSAYAASVAGLVVGLFGVTLARSAGGRQQRGRGGIDETHRH